MAKHPGGHRTSGGTQVKQTGSTNVKTWDPKNSAPSGSGTPHIAKMHKRPPGPVNKKA